MRQTSSSDDAAEQEGQQTPRLLSDLLTRAHQWNGRDIKEFRAITEAWSAMMTAVDSQAMWLAALEVPAALLKAAGCPVSLGDALLFERGRGTADTQWWYPPSGPAC